MCFFCLYKYSEKRLHLDIRSQVMFEPFFMALCYNMNHHPEEKQIMTSKHKRRRKEEERQTTEKEITFIYYSKAPTPHVHTSH